MPQTPASELDHLRREIDRLDGAMVELLAERMRVVQAVAAAKRSTAEGRPAIRPAREAIILRRLVERSRGRVPAATLVRMWRELLAATTRAQAPMSIVVQGPGGRPGLWDLARDHFGSVTPIQLVECASHALRLAAEDHRSLAVLALPDQSTGWWTAMLDESLQALRIVARLPFVAAADDAGALVVGAIDPEPTGADASIVAVATRAGLGQDRLAELLALAGLAPRFLAETATPAGPVRLVELDGFVTSHEPRLAEALGQVREHVLRTVSLGGYARPLTDAA